MHDVDDVQDDIHAARARAEKEHAKHLQPLNPHDDSWEKTDLDDPDLNEPEKDPHPGG